MARISLIVVALGICISLSACGSTKSMTMEEQAQNIDKLLVCPVCPAETIDQAQVPLAQDMRNLVRKKLAEGRSKQQILDYFSADERYGPSVLSSPPKTGANSAIWFAPVVGLLMAITALLLILKAMARKKTGQEAPVAYGPDLQKYLGQVDCTLRDD
ncbi:hypothetical protein FIM12_06310 [SAR202 cluster bacterium AD-804-J14_MRT_500m]|nr:hypothetical protein [SAR202 cluster bacterium AD-804-J14_MRT_500m]